MNYESLKSTRPVPKDRPVMSQRFKKNVCITNKEGMDQVVDNIHNAEFIHVLEVGKYQDGTEYTIVKIDRIP